MPLKALYMKAKSLGNLRGLFVFFANKITSSTIHIAYISYDVIMAVMSCFGKMVGWSTSLHY